MEPKKLFTCYFLYHTLLLTYRIIVIHHDEQIIFDEMQTNEKIIFYVSFDSEFAGGCLTDLMERFGVDKTADFFCHLLNRGFFTAKEDYHLSSANPDFAILMVYAFTKEHRRIYHYLRNVYDEKFAAELSAETMLIGINSLSHIHADDLWGITSVQ